MKVAQAIHFIVDRGALLVFPIKNKKEPHSLWSEFHPRKKMRWEWDSDGDQAVSNLWILREALSRSKKVIYSKWFQGRATFFSPKLFSSILCLLHSENFFKSTLSRQALEILNILEEDSPLSTKKLKKLTDLTGRDNESRYNRAMRELWDRFLIVGFGEVDEGAFPSLAIGATQSLFENIWIESREMNPKTSELKLIKIMERDPLFLKHWNKKWKELSSQKALTKPLHKPLFSNEGI